MTSTKGRVFLDQYLDPSDLYPAQTATPLQANRFEPRFCSSFFSLHMYVGEAHPGPPSKKRAGMAPP